jgi:hypothetical protein
MGLINKRTVVQAGPVINMTPYLKNNQSKNAGGVAQVVERLQAQSPEFKPQYCLKKTQQEVRGTVA